MTRLVIALADMVPAGGGGILDCDAPMAVTVGLAAYAIWRLRHPKIRRRVYQSARRMARTPATSGRVPAAPSPSYSGSGAVPHL